jgi:hypothetical protein
MTFCNGFFSIETQQKITANPDFEESRRQPCEVCGQHVRVETNKGERVPALHERPEPRKQKDMKRPNRKASSRR